MIPNKFSGLAISLQAQDESQTLPFKVYASGEEDCMRQIIVIHEWWGLNGHIKGITDQLANARSRAFAIDLYDGATAGDPQTAQKLMKSASVSPKKILAKVHALVLHAKKENPTAKIGVIGWCFGGSWSLQTAIHEAENISAAVVFYGQLETEHARLASLVAPVLGVFAKRDGWVHPEMVSKFTDAMQAAGKILECHSYDADHAFANPSGKTFDEANARDAWGKTLAFLDKHLGSTP